MGSLDFMGGALMIHQMIYREVRVWANLHHKNILRFFGTTSGFGPLPAFITPWMEHGSLTNYLSHEFFKLSMRDRFMLVSFNANIYLSCPTQHRLHVA
jgi:serine/threonine protein kinase